MITVENTGDVALDSVTVSDSLAPDCDASLGTLGAGAMTSYGCSLTNVTADFTNQADVSGTPPLGPNVTDSDTAVVLVPSIPVPGLGPAGLVVLGAALALAGRRYLRRRSRP